jgi:hypothetical protein
MYEVMAKRHIYDPYLLPDGSWNIAGNHIEPCNELTALLASFTKLHGAAKAHIFWCIADILWNGDERPQPLFAKHPWAEQMIKAAASEKYLSIGGAASSGKSYTMAGWAVVNWLAAPDRTLILVTSTTLREARKRIWGAVITLLTSVPGLPIKIRDSIGSANYIDSNGVIFDRAGLSLIAAEKSKTREATAKLIGIKQERVMLVADELSELAHSIVQTSMSNLASNPELSIVAMSNPCSRFDAFGDWAEPKKGWDSIVPEVDYSWRTKYGGLYLRFDAERSPNLGAGEDLYPWLPTQARIDEAKKNLGEASRGYMRMYRAVFFDTDEAEGVYGESELARSCALNSTKLRDVVKLAALDPAFTNGGDRTMVRFGELGYDSNNQYCLQLLESLLLYEDETNKAVPRTYQIVQQLKEACEKRGVKPENVAIDATGAGNPFCDVVAAMWSPDILRVVFAGKATERRVSMNNSTPCYDLYANRVTEIWFAGKELIRCGQLYGVDQELAREMTARQYETIKGGEGLKMRVEPKPDFKKRAGYSPDAADAAFLLIDLARNRHGLIALEPLKKDDSGNGSTFGNYHRQVSMKDLQVESRTNYSSLLDL